MELTILGHDSHNIALICMCALEDYKGSHQDIQRFTARREGSKTMLG
jgi:hypothetical protein